MIGDMEGEMDGRMERKRGAEDDEYDRDRDIFDWEGLQGVSTGSASGRFKANKRIDRDG